MRSVAIDLGPTTRVCQYHLHWKKDDPADRDGERIFELHFVLVNPRAEALAKRRGLQMDYLFYYGHRADCIELVLKTRFVMRRGDWLGAGGISAKGHETAVRRALKSHASEICRLFKLAVRHEIAKSFSDCWDAFNNVTKHLGWDRAKELAARCRSLGKAPMPANFARAA